MTLLRAPGTPRLQERTTSRSDRARWRTRTKPALVLVVLPLLAATGCVDSGSGGVARLGEPVPAYEAAVLQGGDTVSLADLRGAPVVVNVWATWCAPCRHETPYLQSVFERYRSDGLRMVGVSVDGRGSADDAMAFMDEKEVTYTRLHDPEMRAMDTFRVLGLPATYVVDAEGIVRFARQGPVFEGDAEFEGTLRDLLAEGG